MAITIDWGNTFVIDVDIDELSLVSGSIYDFDTDAFRLKLKALEASYDGAPFPKTHRHVAADTIAGATDSKKIIILPPYSVRFPDTQISIRLQGSNNNIFDVGAGILVQTQAQVIPNNSFGSSTSGFTPADAIKLLELWKLHGLELDNPITVTPTSRITEDSSIEQVISGDGENNSKVTRQ